MTAPEPTSALRPFADPATEILEDTSGGLKRVRLTRNGLLHEYIIHQADGSIEARLPEPRRYVGVASLLASSAFADLDRLADTQRRLVALEHFDLSQALRPTLKLNGHSGSIDDINEALSPGMKTRVVLLDGPAGIGKTFLISWLVKLRAEAYLARSGARPILHVRSRGRRLASLQEVFALSSQVVRAGFTFDQIPALVRHGAWFALRDFFHDLSGAGVCILAGRETFFDEQRLRHQLRESQDRIDLTMVHLGAPHPDEARKWLRSKGWLEEDIQEPQLADMLKPDSYVLRPFFLNELANVGSGGTLEETPRITIIKGILRRESKLLAESLGIPIDSTMQGLRQLYREVAMDMAERESDTVDIEYLGFICEVAFSGLLEQEDLSKLKHRIGSVALFEADEIEHLRRFPHSEVQNFYLAEGLIGEIATGRLPSVMRRSVMGSDLLESFIEVFDRENSLVANKFVAFLARCVQQEISGDRLPLNATSLLLATYMRSVADHPTRLAHLTANEVVFRDVVEEVLLEHLLIDRADVRGADLSAVNFVNTQVVILLVDQRTRFGDRLPAIHLLQDFNGDQWKVVTTPRDVAIRLADSKGTSQRIRVTGAVESRTPLLDLFDRVCRRALRRFHFRTDDENDPGNQLLKHQLWPDIETILTESERLIRKTAPMSGARGELLHIKNPEALLWPGTDQASADVRRRVVERGMQLQAAE